MIRDILVSEARLVLEIDVPAQPGIPQACSLKMVCKEDNLTQHRMLWTEMVSKMQADALDGFFEKLTEIKQ